jgi:hypothetical protein
MSSHATIVVRLVVAIALLGGLVVFVERAYGQSTHAAVVGGVTDARASPFPATSSPPAASRP